MLNRFTFSFAWTLIALLANVAYSQNLPQIKHWWFSAGVGKSQFPSGMVALGYEFNNTPTQLIARYLANQQIFSDIRPGIKVNELALLYGLSVGKFRFSTGLSTVWGVNRGKFWYSDPDPLIYGSTVYETIKYRTIGIPAEIRFITTNKAKDLGIGLTGFGNWNAKRSFAGLNLSIYIGGGIK